VNHPSSVALGDRTTDLSNPGGEHHGALIGEPVGDAVRFGASTQPSRQGLHPQEVPDGNDSSRRVRVDDGSDRGGDRRGRRVLVDAVEPGRTGLPVGPDDVERCAFSGLSVRLPAWFLLTAAVYNILRITDLDLQAT